jgi:hypothetical protein
MALTSGTKQSFAGSIFSRSRPSISLSPGSAGGRRAQPSEHLVRPPDATGVERITQVLMTPDGKYCVYTGTRRLGTVFVVNALK